MLMSHFHKQQAISQKSLLGTAQIDSTVVYCITYNGNVHCGPQKLGSYF